MPTPPITTLRIQGFKSLVDVQLQPRQLNIFIGKPNVGKSNILEALSLLGAGYSRAEKFMGEFIRYEEPNQLLTDGVAGSEARISTNLGEAQLWTPYGSTDVVLSVGFSDYTNAFYSIHHTESAQDAHYAILRLEEVKSHIDALSEEHIWPVSILSGSLDSTGKLQYLDGPHTYGSKVRKYEFRREQTHSKRDAGQLLPPYGGNLFEVMKNHRRLRQEATALFDPHRIQLVLRMTNRTIETQKNINGDVYSYPLSSTTDTFQRFIFHLAAIESNEGSVLLFEEPETGSFPTYISQLAERIAEDVREARNQYFITTHSPYLLDQLIENTSADQVAVFIVGYADYQTTVTQIPDDQLGHLLDLSSDVFFNLNRLPLTDADAA